MEQGQVTARVVELTQELHSRLLTTPIPYTWLFEEVQHLPLEQGVQPRVHKNKEGYYWPTRVETICPWVAYPTMGGLFGPFCGSRPNAD